MPIRLMRMPLTRATQGRMLLRLAAIIVLIVAINRLAAWAIDPEYFAPGHFSASDPMVISAAAIYALLLSLPFVPGVEIGAAMLSVLGPPVAGLVYGATLAGLTLAYGVGRLVPLHYTIAGLRRLGLVRVADWVAKLAETPEGAGFSALSDGVSARFGRVLLRHPELALIVLFNIPGNALIGGGGGIALIAGLSRALSFPRFVLATAIGVAPVPLAVYFMGVDPFA